MHPAGSVFMSGATCNGTPVTAPIVIPPYLVCILIPSTPSSKTGVRLYSRLLSFNHCYSSPATKHLPSPVNVKVNTIPKLKSDQKHHDDK